MCGIVGFNGVRQAAPVLLDGLSKLECSSQLILSAEQYIENHKILYTLYNVPQLP